LTHFRLAVSDALPEVEKYV